MNDPLFGYEADPIHPNLLVKQVEDQGIEARTIRVIDLRGPDVKTYLFWEGQPLSSLSEAGMAAKRWFQAHPEVKN